MAEKKFNGAPFGTQTARFDVTGVHPKKKVPGSFTQIPYDKYSMVEQDDAYLSHSNRIVKIDSCLQNIRVALKFTKEELDRIESVKKTACKNEKENTRDTKLNIQIKNHRDHFSKFGRLTSLKGSGGESILCHNDTKSKTSFPDTDCKQRSTKRSKESICWDQEKEHSTYFDKSDNAINDETLTSDFKENNDKKDVETKKEATQPSNETQPGSTRKSISFQDHLLTKPVKTDYKKYNSLTKVILCDVSDNLAAEASCDGNRLSTGGICPKILKTDYQPNSDIIVVPRNSDNSEDVLEDLPKPQKQVIIKQKEISCAEFLKRKLGPGTYNTVVGGFSPSCVENRASGPGWGRQIEVERLAALPHLLYKEQWEENKMLKRKLGPGSYEIKDFIQMNNLKPKSSKGICENLAQRFEKGVTSFTPGPGTYGMGGVPQKAMEEKNQLSMSTKGLLDSGDRKRNLPSVGSHLGPGTYRHKTCTEEMLNKVTSLRGPYELYSGDRNKPISEGYQAAPKLADLGPGQYEIGSFVDELHGTHKKSHGVFGRMTQYPEVPTERLFLFSQSHCPKKKNIPGPGSYSVQDMSKPQGINSPGFLSSAKRDDKLSQKFFTRNFNPVGAGRYDIQKFHEAQDINGHSSVFKSKTGKPGLQMAKFLQERIRAKDVPVQDRMFITEPEKPPMSRSLTVA